MDRVRRIELLVRAVEAGSFAKAARSLELTPSAVSHAIAELEKQMGVPLLYRTTRQLCLTEDGEDIYRRGSEIVRQLDELETHVRKAPGRVSGILRIGLPVSLNRNVIMPVVPIFLRRHPEVRLQCYMLSHPKDMRAEGIDLLLSLGSPDANLVARRVAQLRPAVYASPTYLAQHPAPTNPEDLLRHACLVFKVPWMSKPLDEWEFERGGERRTIKVLPALLTNDREGLIEAVLAGAGVIRMGCFNPALVTSGRLRRVMVDWTCPPGFSIYAMYRKSSRMQPKLAAFLEFIAEAFAAFDPEELTLAHDGQFAVSIRRTKGYANE